jgi:integrase
LKTKELINKGTVHRRNDGYWAGMVSYKNRKGEYCRKNFCGLTKKSVKQKMRNYVIEFQKEVEESDETKQTVRVSMQKWLEVFKLQTVERATYDGNINTAHKYIYPVIGEKSVVDITSFELKNLLSQMMISGYAHSTVKKTYCLLNQFFKYLYFEEILPNNPMKNVDMIKKANFLSVQGKEDLPERDTITILTDEEIELLKEEVFARRRNGTYKHQQAAAYILMLNTGLRVGEVLGLINSDIDIETRILYVRRAVKEVNSLVQNDSESKRELIIGNPKTKSSKRAVPLNQRAIDMIKLLQKERCFGDEAPLIPNDKGEFTRPSIFRGRWERVLIDAGVEQKGLHSLRHTFATILVNGRKDENGNIKSLPVRKVADILGHTTTAITEKYYVKRDLRNLSGITDEFEIGRN